MNYGFGGDVSIMIKHRKFADGNLCLLTENIFNDAEMNWLNVEFDKDDFETSSEDNGSWRELNRKYKSVKLPWSFENNFIDRINDEFKLSLEPLMDLWIDEVNPNSSTQMPWHYDTSTLKVAGQIYFPINTVNENDIGRGTRFLADDIIVCPQYSMGMGYLMLKNNLLHSPTDMSIHNSNHFEHRRSIYIREVYKIEE